jgi:UDP-GlcNAc:undecaprenyl-phosphate GlcNAc-1-phosphate transferase
MLEGRFVDDRVAFALVIAASALLSALVTPLVARVARWSGLVVAPRTDRWHKAATPLLGGAALAFAILLLLAATMPINRATLGVFVGAVAAFGLGLLDDFRHLGPTTKLVGQVLVGSVLVIAGVSFEVIPFAPLAYVVTVFWVVAMMNAVNLLDNMDGLAAGVMAIAGLALGIGAVSQNMPIVLIGGITGGAALGFLIHNFYPAKIFMGDAGSLLLGFLVAAAAVLNSTRTVHDVAIAVAVPLAVLALPIFDTILVIAARGRAGRPISQGGRDHTSHRLVALGLSDRRTVLLLYAIAAFMAVIALGIQQIHESLIPAFALALVVFAVFGTFLVSVNVYGEDRAAPRDAGKRQLRSLGRLVLSYSRFSSEVGLDVVLLTIAYYTSYLVRFESTPEPAWVPLFEASVPLVVGLQLFALVAFRVYRTLWRYLAVTDVFAIVRAIGAGTAGAALAVVIAYRFENYSRAVFLFDGLLASVLVVGSRAFFLWLHQAFSNLPQPGERRVLIVGANDSGILAFRLLSRAADVPYRAIGFLDADIGKQYRRVAGIPVVGIPADLQEVAVRTRADLVLLALEDDDEPTAQGLRAACDVAGIECREFLVPR